MVYKIIIKKQAKKMLISLPKMIRKKMTEKILCLGQNPDDETLDVKPLKGVSFYRLRVGRWRVIFDRQDEVKVIAIEKIKARGDVYK